MSRFNSVNSYSVSVKPLIFLSDLEFELLNSLSYPQDLLLKGCFVIFQVAQLLLQSLSFGILVAVVPRYLLDDPVQLVGEGLARILALHGQHRLQGLLLRPKDLHLFLMHVQVLSQLPGHLVQVCKLAIQMGRIILGSSCGVHTHD